MRKPARQKSVRPRAPTKNKINFHAPSFSSGTLVGAAIVLIAAYAPEIIGSNNADSNRAAVVSQMPEISFEFPDLLKNNEVAANPETYSAPPIDADRKNIYRIQVASFRNATDADVLRAKLLLSDLPSSIQSSKVSGETWYRVVVGPFEKQAIAQRAMTRLRQQNFTAIWIN